MASTTFIKDTGVLLLLLLLGLLLPSALVSGQSDPTTSAAMTNTGSTMLTSSISASTNAVTSASGAPSAASATSGGSSAATGASAASTIVASSVSGSSTNPEATAPTIVPPASTMAGSTVSSSTADPASGSTVSSSTAASASGSTVSSSTAASASGSTVSSSTAASASGSSTSSAATVTTATSGNTPDVTGNTGTTSSNSTSMISCPSFICNYSDCYSMYTSQNTTSCAADAYCQLIRQSEMCYVASCSVSCADDCNNMTQTNCSVKCCNSTGCLNGTFEDMMMKTTTTVSTATTTRPPVTTTKATTNPQTTAKNGNKCHANTCNNKKDCYKYFSNTSLKTCSASELHCELKKETIDSKETWTAGCTRNCSGQNWCKNSAAPCHLECCNATMTSCLFLNGTSNVPSFATRGPHLHIELIALLICLLGLSSLM